MQAIVHIHTQKVKKYKYKIQHRKLKINEEVLVITVKY